MSWICNGANHVLVIIVLQMNFNSGVEAVSSGLEDGHYFSLLCKNVETISLRFWKVKHGHLVHIGQDWPYLELCSTGVNTPTEWTLMKSHSPGFHADDPWINQESYVWT